MRSISFILLLIFAQSCCSSGEEKSKGIEIKGTVAMNQDTTVVSKTLTELEIAANSVGTDTTVLSDGSMLYYQFNGDSLWLTLEGDKKLTIKSYELDMLVGYHYRLDYQLLKEFDKYLLFRYGCPANGPCKFDLVDKRTGMVSRKFGELIYDHNQEQFPDYLIYFSNSGKQLVFDNINTGHRFKHELPADFDMQSYPPEYLFTKVEFTAEKFRLSYETKRGTTEEFTIDLKKYRN